MHRPIAWRGLTRDCDGKSRVKRCGCHFTLSCSMAFNAVTSATPSSRDTGEILLRSFHCHPNPSCMPCPANESHFHHRVARLVNVGRMGRFGQPLKT